MPLVEVPVLPSRQPLPGWHGRFFHGDDLTFAYYDIDADAAPLHEHEHPQEEVWNVIEGEMVIAIDGTEHVARAGSAAVIPPNTPHSARVLRACRAIVVDHPRRDRVGGVSTD